MAEIKWIKITTDMFDNRKIKHLRRLPEGDSIVLLWVMLLTMAGRCNAGGMIFLTENIPYTAKMLADELDFEESTVQLGLQVLEQLDMVVMKNGHFAIAGWEEHQNIEGLDKIREQNRLRKQRQRDHERLLICDSHATSRDSHATEEDKEEDKDKDKEEERESIGEPTAPDTTPKAVRHKYGEYKNVFLTDEDLEKLKAEFPADWSKRIDRLSGYIASTGKKYKNHLATIRNWARKDRQERRSTGFETGNPFLEMLEEERRL